VDTWKLEEGCKEIAVPNLDVVGWYDHCNGDMLLFRTMVREARTEVARKGSRIIIGPWGHGTYRSRYGNIDFGPEATLLAGAGKDIERRWFDYWLKGIANGVDKDAPVRIFVMGDNQWRNEQSWPLERAKEKVLFIASQGNASTPNGDGRLVDVKPERGTTDKYVYDPRDPVPTPFGAQRSIPADQRSFASRKDVLVYQTEPIKERIEVTGSPIVELYAASSAPDTDWFVRLIDVAPEGLARDAANGMVRARYRKGFTKAEFINPGEVVRYTIQMHPTSNAFLPGHRIRLDITSSDFPNYDRNHNTAANQNVDATLAVANQTIHLGAEHATRLILPWIPNPVGGESTVKQKFPSSNATEDLYGAILAGDLGKVRELLDRGGDANEQDPGHTWALFRAVLIGRKDIAELLLAHGGNVNSIVMRNMPLVEAAMRVVPNRNELVELFVAKGAAIPPLHLALYRKDRVKARSLIEEGADVNQQTPHGTTPLMMAVDAGFVDIAQLLVAKGASVNAKDFLASTPLFRAANAGTDQKDMAELLIAKGAEVNVRDAEYRTPFSYSREKGNKGTMEVLRQHGGIE